MKSSLLLLPAFALTAAAPEPGWSLRLPIASVPGARLQRVVLPARALLALRRADGGDVRVLDARGRAQPIARVPAPAPMAAQVTLAPVPILGAPDALKVTGVTLQVDDGQAHVVRLDGAPAAASGGPPLGVLLDTRHLGAPAHALTLDLAAPANQPVTVTLGSSADLQDWTAQGERVLFRAGADAPFVLPLYDEDLRGRYLRVTWRAQGRLLAPVTVRRATMALAASADSGRLAVDATLPPLADGHHAAFALPVAVAPAALDVVPAAGDPPTAITVSGRQDREQPWTAVGNGVAAATARPIELGAAYREWRIGAASAGDGFTAPPRVRLRFAPMAVAFVAAGTAPYTLAVGRADADDSFMDVRSLEQMTGEVAGRSPLAAVPAPPPAPLALAALASGVGRTAWLLWGVLLIGVAALGGIAWSLSRPRRETAVCTTSDGVAPH